MSDMFFRYFESKIILRTFIIKFHHFPSNIFLVQSKEKPHKHWINQHLCGGFKHLGDRNWTCDLLNPIQARYQTALHPDIFTFIRNIMYYSIKTKKSQVFFSIFTIFLQIMRRGSHAAHYIQITSIHQVSFSKRQRHAFCGKYCSFRHPKFQQSFFYIPPYKKQGHIRSR